MTAEISLHDIDAILDTEREAIVDGRLEEIETLIARKEQALEAARLADSNPDALRRLREKAQRNEQLLNGAMTGLRRAIGRIEEIRRGNAGLNTYTQSGAKTLLGHTGAAQVEKKW